MQVDTDSSQLLDALRTVAVNGSYNASRSLSKWFQRGVRLTSEGFQSTPISEIASVLGDPGQPIAAIRMPLAGDIDGAILLVFPEDVGLALVDMLLQQPEGTSTSFGDLEQSSLQETGNIVGTAYANSFAKWLRLSIEPRAPEFAHDMACAIIQPLLMEMVAERDEVFLAMTDFQLDSRKLEWAMLIMPTAESMNTMEKRCHVDLVRQQALRTIAINGAFNASRAMSKWLKRGVKISTEGFSRVGLNEVLSQFDAEEPVVGLHMPMTDGVHGHALLVVPGKCALKLASLLMGGEGATELGEIERSCLEETGNIISSSFVNSWSTWLDIQLEPASPEYVHDLPEAVIDGVLAEQALVGDDVFLARTEFIVDEQWLEFAFLLIPAPSAMRLIEAAAQ